MVRNYQRRTNKGAYNKDQLREAVLAVKSGSLSGYKAAKVYNIPRMTIMDHVHNKRTSNSIGRKTTLSPEVEKSLAMCLHIMEKNGFGLTRTEVLEMVGEYIKQNKIPSSFKSGVPGKDWFVLFSKRHNLSIKKPQAVECARKNAIDPYVVFPYFDLLEKTIKDLGLQQKPHAIWNLDETSFSKDPSKTKIIGMRGFPATRVIATCGRDNTTVLLGASADGQKTPPLIIFKGKNVWDEWTSPDAYPGTTYAATKNGWMESEIFEMFFKKSFLPTIGDQRPVLLIYDGHSTHVGLNIIEEARRANVTIIKIPAHTSHVLQPLDVSVMKSFKDQWDIKLVQWQRLNIGTPLPKKEFSRLIGSIWSQMNPQVLRNGFRKTGIYPLNRNEVQHTIFDPLQLKRWQQSILNTPAQIRKKPQTLFSMALNCVNKICFNEESDKRRNKLIDQRTDYSNGNDLHAPMHLDLADEKISFEELLLQKVKRSDNIVKPKKRKVASGAEVITHDDVLNLKKDEQSSKKKKGKRQSKPSMKHTDDVVLLKDLSKNNSQLVPFVAQNSQDLPKCLQNHELDRPNINITSNVVIKKSAAVSKQIAVSNEDYLLPGPSGLYNTNTRKTRIINRTATSIKISAKKITKEKDNNKNTEKENKDPVQKNTDEDLHHGKHAALVKQKQKDISRSSSITSVSGSCSYHSDSDIVNISSDCDFNNYEYSEILYENIPNTSDFENKQRNEKTVKPSNLRFNLRNKCKEKDTEVNLKPTENIYFINDHVLVRYYNRNNWTYYVGIIENISIQQLEFYYSVRFYKTIKTPRLLFKMTKKVDRDDVPDISIVKKVNLSIDQEVSNSFVLSCDEDELYFN